MEKLLIARGNEDIELLSNKVNQHGLIVGATGSGKTVTLKVLCEYFSDLGVPTILSDVKGDLSNLASVGEMNDNLKSRLDEMNITDFNFKNYPVNLWDVYGEAGLPLRVSVSEMGPILLSQILDLNDTQAGILNIAFRVSDEEGLLLLDIKDLRSMLNHLSDNREVYSKKYGNITTQSISAIMRKLLYIEDMGADKFLGEPSLDIRDLMKTDSDGRGFVNIISAAKLINDKNLYSMFLLWLLSELFESLPEVGNPEIPKLVFFFDEAHLLFDNANKMIMDKIEQVVRLIRSKGVGIFFITQNPLDIPDSISSQLGNRIVHQLRAFSPKELKAVQKVSETFRANADMNVKDEIVNLRTGEALISFLDEKGAPSITKKGLVLPPHSSFTPLSQSDVDYIVKNSDLHQKYSQSIDRESAYEILQTKLQNQIKEEPEKQTKKSTKQEKTPIEDFATKSINSMLGSFTRQIGRDIARGIFGSIKKSIKF